MYESVGHSVVSDSLWLHGLWPAMLLYPWDFPGKNTGVGCHSLFHGIFPTQGSNPGLLHCRQIPYHLSHQGSPPRLCLNTFKAGKFPASPEHPSLCQTVWVERSPSYARLKSAFLGQSEFILRFPRLCDAVHYLICTSVPLCVKWWRKNFLWLLKILNEAAYVLPLKMFNEHLCPLLKLLLNWQKDWNSCLFSLINSIQCLLLQSCGVLDRNCF